MSTTNVTVARPALASGAAIFSALMPKCPLCVMAIIGALGLELPRVAAWMTPLTIVLLSLCLALIASVARAKRRWMPLAVAIVAAVVVIAGRVALQSNVVARSGCVVLVGASIWSGRSTKKCTSCVCAKETKCE